MRVAVGRSVLELVLGTLRSRRLMRSSTRRTPALGGGGGVDGAIHRAAGPGILQETRARYPQGCPTGSAVVTSAGSLKARYLFHAVGPIWRGGTKGSPTSSGPPISDASTWRRSMSAGPSPSPRSAPESMAIPAISPQSTP